MENTNDTEDFNEWQQIEHHPSPETSSPTVHQSSVAWNTVADHQSTSAEGMSSQIVPKTINSEDGTSSPSAASSDEDGAAPMPAAPPLDWRFRVASEGRKLMKLRFEAVRPGVVRVASKVRNCTICMGAFWSITCMTGAAAAVAAVLVYMGIRRRRRRVGRQSVDHLVYLLREKDEVSIH